MPAADDREADVVQRHHLHGHPDMALAWLADRQHGVVARRQLTEVGVSLAMVRARLASGHLAKLHPGVYAVGHRQLRPAGRALAAVLAVGPGAVLSHRDAAGLHGLRPANHRLTDVTSLGQRRAPDGVRVHRTTVLPAVDVTVVDRIPVTSVARTLVDLAAIVPADHIAKALSEAERIHRVDFAAIEDALARVARRRGRGHARMRAALDELRAQGVQLTHSELEDRFTRLLARHGLPRPQRNVMVEGREVDAHWPRHRLVAELDGWAFHKTRRAAQRDRGKTNELQLDGYLVLRFMHDDLVRRAAWVAHQIRRGLNAPDGPAPR